MKTILLAALVVSSSFAFAQDKYYGAKSTEALLRFTGKIRLAPGLPAADKRAAIDNQVQHLIGHFQAESFLNTFKYPGVLGQKYKLSLGRERASGGAVEVSYDFEGKVNFHRNVFRSSDTASIPLNIPLDPDTIYSLGVVGEENLCTDEHYNSEGDFFYFWDPEKDGCPLSGNTTDVLRLTGTLEKLENTKSTYPEYDRLYGKDGLKIAVFIGYIDGPTSRDMGADAYRGIRDALKAQGFALDEETRNFRQSGSREIDGVNFRSRLSTEVKNKLGQKMTVEVQLLLSETESDNRDQTFHKHLVEAYQSADIVAYDGHSGLGGNLDLEILPPFSFDRHYQIFFFNGCSSYPYFNGNYFASKPGGSKNLEIITAGQPTLTSTSVDNMMAFLDPFTSGGLASWQTIMNRIEASNGEEETYLMGVNGDEDNQFHP